MLAHVQSCVHEADIIRVVLYPQNRNEDKLFDGGDKIILIL